MAQCADKVTIPGLVPAFSEPTYTIDPLDRCCNNCVFFSPCPFNENGWCGKYPSRSVNTDMCSVCPQFKNSN